MVHNTLDANFVLQARKAISGPRESLLIAQHYTNRMQSKEKKAFASRHIEMLVGA
jgi:hypothetical protein